MRANPWPLLFNLDSPYCTPLCLGSNIGFVHPASHLFFFCFIPPSRPTKRFHPDPACLYLSTCNSCKRYWQTIVVLKSIENTLYCFRTKGNIPEIRTWNPQWNVDMVEGQNRTATWKMSARGFSSLGISVCSKRYKILRNHLHHPVCSLCYWNSIFYIICNLQIWIQNRKIMIRKEYQKINVIQPLSAH